MELLSEVHSEFKFENDKAVLELWTALVDLEPLILKLVLPSRYIQLQVFKMDLKSDPVDTPGSGITPLLPIGIGV